jgi:hypothetical protein
MQKDMSNPICPPGSKAELAFKEFHEAWPIERLERMKLSEYSRAKESNPSSYRESLCYYLEERTPAGMGGHTAKKFGIWERADKSAAPKLGDIEMDADHCWDRALGTDKQQAFVKLRSMIVAAAKAARAGRLDDVEKIGLSRLLKWKVAFCYQDPANPTIVGCFKREALENSVDDEAKDLPMSVLLAKARLQPKPNESMVECGWRIYDQWKLSQELVVESQSGVEEPGQAYKSETAPENPVNRGRRQGTYPTDNPRAHFWLYSLPKPGSPGDMDELVSLGEMVNDFQPEKAYSDIKATDANTREWMAMAFAEAIQPGDVIVAHEPSSGHVRSIGIVTGEYSFDPSRSEHARHYRKVEWIPDSGRPNSSGGWAKKRLTSLNSGEEEWGWSGAMSDLMDNAGLPRPKSFTGTSWSALGDLKLSQASLTQAWASKGAKPVLRILCGPPGTGKTYNTADEVFRLCLESAPTKKRTPAMSELRMRGNIEFVTFHQNYDYADFVEGYRPSVTDGRMTYELRDGVLKRIARRAERHPNQPFVLIIDEINRGNLPKIFGELYFLLEYRDQAIDLMYSSDSAEPFSLPKNIFVIGTMKPFFVVRGVSM